MGIKLKKKRGKSLNMGNKQALSAKEADALTAKTNWTKEDLEALHLDFKKADVKKTGELDLKAFIGLLKARIPMDEAGYKNLFAQMDTDNSGTVSFTELATSLSVVGKGTAEEKLQFCFEVTNTVAQACSTIPSHFLV